MTNLRKVDAYNIGLDIGTNSVGWAVTDINGEMCQFKGKPTWGSRLFKEASHAADARAARGLRRRYDRRRQRLDLLQVIFQDEVALVDPDFFTRLNQSRLHNIDKSENIRDYTWPLFNSKDFNEVDYYKRFPTIYHLRAYLATTDEKADIRLIYLALHNIVKHRGNFLYQDNKGLTSSGVSVGTALEEMCDALIDWAEIQGFICDPQVEQLGRVLADTRAGKKQLTENMRALWGIQTDVDSDLELNVKKTSDAISGAIVGASSDLANVFFLGEDAPDGAKTKIYLSKEEDVDEFYKCCPTEGVALFEAMQKVYSAYVLQGILSYRPGQTISNNKIAQYEQYGQDLALLKALVREYRKDAYNDFFRGDMYEGTSRYNAETASGYTKYNSVHTYSYDDFAKDVKKLLGSTGAATDERYLDMVARFDEEHFLRRLKTSDNGAIPFQLHLEEMHQIIENQARHYPFLKAEVDGYSTQEKIESLVTFRIPYYVGPLTTKNAARAGSGKDARMRFAWSVRKEGTEGQAIMPWNWDKIIDKDASAENFIMRMTSTCTYIQGEPVLPKSSLLYEEFCVLNELNGSHYTQDGDREVRFDYRDRLNIIDDLFKHGSVTYKKIEDWMHAHGRSNVHVRGGQGASGFESKLSSYLFFKKALGVDVIPESDYPMIEEIILWSTIFEDKDIYKRKIQQKYGERLTSDQINTISKKRFTGWGKLSRKLLDEIKVESDEGLVSIMDVLRGGNPNYGNKSKTMIFMEIIHDDELGFNKAIEKENIERVSDGGIRLEDLPGSPQLRRGINQALRIVDEITKIARKPPANIYIEVTRDDDISKKGRRTTKRYDALEEALNAFKRESPGFFDSEVLRDFKNTDKKDLDDRLTLYFMQAGKSLYSGKPLNIMELSTYEVDHILPQSYTKDDSYENKALVLKNENQRKTSELLLPASMRHEMRSYWDALHNAGLIGDKKYNNLNREHIKVERMRGFIARQLVETSQIVKLTEMMLSEKYPQTNVRPVKASLSSQLKKRVEIYKCREANDYHHAHDALLACTVGRFVDFRYPEIYTNPIKYAKMAKDFIKRQSEELIKHGKMPGDSTFIVSSFLKSGFNEDTGEIFRDTWNAQMEIARLKRYVNDKRCYISRMVEEESGAFWDQTIYSPYDSKKKAKLKLPLKKGLDPKIYGSYSREQFAYFFIYRAIKKKKEVLEFAPVPCSIAKQIEQSKGALDEYAKTLAYEAGEEFVCVERTKIYKQQLIEFGGSRFYLTGKREIRNATQVSFNNEEIKVFSDLVDGEEVSQDKCLDLFNGVVKSVCERSPKVALNIKLASWCNSFASLSSEEQKQVLLAVVDLANGKRNMVDLTAVGGSKNTGCLNPTFSRILSLEGGIDFIDQSVTGMFEKVTHIGL